MDLHVWTADEVKLLHKITLEIEDNKTQVLYKIFVFFTGALDSKTVQHLSYSDISTQGCNNKKVILNCKNIIK